ncbi:MAG: hypothetical protein M8354_14445 [Halalkalicoccus sp.]|nr:hypothetical protein [Halalkalicoccus sp.]
MSRDRSTALSRFRGPGSVFDALMLAGPAVLVAIALLGRTALTTALAIAYLLAFVGYVLYNGLYHAH